VCKDLNNVLMWTTDIDNSAKARPTQGSMYDIVGTLPQERLQ